MTFTASARAAPQRCHRLKENLRFSEHDQGFWDSRLTLALLGIREFEAGRLEFKANQYYKARLCQKTVLELWV